MSSVQGPSCAPVAPPTPQEISRKLSVHNKPAKSKKPAPPPVSGTESDSDSYFSPDHSPHAAGTSHFSVPHHPPHALAPSASTSKPLTSIAERRSGSGEDSDDDDDDEGEEWRHEEETTFANRNDRQKTQVGDNTLKSGYLWKKGERRHAWKKRWFVLRPSQLAFYKTSAEYELLRLLDLNDIHSCSPVALKRHAHSLCLVSPSRTYYLQSSSETDMEDWVARLNEAREVLKTTSTQNSVAASSIPIPIPSGTNRQQHSQGHSPATQITIGTGAGTAYSPPSAHGYGGSQHPMTSESDSEDALGGGAMGYSPSAPTTMVTSPSKSKIDPSKVIVQGYLMKCSKSKRRGWRKRWFVLTGEKLTYSASHMDVKRQRSVMLSQILDALEYDLEKPPGGGSSHHHLVSPGGSPPHALGPGMGASPRMPGASSQISAAPEQQRHGHAPQEASGGSDAAAAAGDHPTTGSAGGQHTFKVVTTKRSLLLSAPSEEEEIKWLSAVRAVIARRPGPASNAGVTGGGGTAVAASSAPGGAGGVGTGAEGGGQEKQNASSGVGRRRSASGASGIGPQ